MFRGVHGMLLCLSLKASLLTAGQSHMGHKALGVGIDEPKAWKMNLYRMFLRPTSLPCPSAWCFHLRSMTVGNDLEHSYST